jgi:hypothetical protein
MLYTSLFIYAFLSQAAAFTPFAHFAYEVTPKISDHDIHDALRTFTTKATCPNIDPMTMMGYVSYPMTPAQSQGQAQQTRQSRRLDKIKALATTVAAIKQELSRRYDLF